MSQQTRIRADTSKLEDLVKQLGSTYVARVGILGNKAATNHQETDLTNAELGVIQEFGSITANIPPRSFLRMPIETHEEEIVETLEKTGAKERIERGEIKGLYRQMGIAAEGVVQRAFATGGYGNWEPNKPATIAAKGSSAPLIDTAELRRSITSDVVKRSEI